MSDGVNENNECGEKTGRDFVRQEPITGWEGLKCVRRWIFILLAEGSY